MENNKNIRILFHFIFDTASKVLRVGWKEQRLQKSGIWEMFEQQFTSRLRGMIEEKTYVHNNM